MALASAPGCDRQIGSGAVGAPPSARTDFVVGIAGAPSVPETSGDSPAAEAADARVVLVTLDGVRWQDVVEGGEVLCPRLTELGAHGVALGADEDGCGVVHAHGTSNISLPGYLEILTGRATPCTSNACARTRAPTILDDAASAGLGAVASISSWEVIERAASMGSTDVLVSAGKRPWPRPLDSESHLAALVGEGRRGPSYPSPSRQYRVDAWTAEIAFEYWATARPTLLHVGLGDSDEWAHRGDRARYADALRAADAFVGRIADALAETGDSSTTVIVTADHGRATSFRDHGPAYPESNRSFVVAFGAGIGEPGTRCAPRDVELRDVGATVRQLIGLPKDESAEAGRAIESISGSDLPHEDSDDSSAPEPVNQAAPT